jgi:hypothetical protein
VVSLILTRGGHGNIVTILGHDWLIHSFNQCYYIDMELCDFSLYDYINYHKNSSTKGLTEITVGQPFVSCTCSKELWNFGEIAKFVDDWATYRAWFGIHAYK